VLLAPEIAKTKTITLPLTNTAQAESGVKCQRVLIMRKGNQEKNSLAVWCISRRLDRMHISL
jgi:hypothetical protein